MDFAYALHKTPGILLGALAVVLAMYWLGRTLLSRFPAVLNELTATEAKLFSQATGAVCLSSAGFVLCALGLVYDAAVVAILAAALFCWIRWGRRPDPFRLIPERPEETSWRRLVLLVSLAYGPLYFIHALAPEQAPDAVGYHLGLVARYYREHGFFLPIESSYYAFLSQGSEMIYLFAFALGRHSAPALVHLSFLLATLAGIVSLGRRLGAPRAGWLGAILFGVSSVVGTDAVTAYNDVLLAFFQFMLLYGILIWRQSDEDQWLPLLGLLAGFGFAVKYTAVYASAAALIYIGFRTLRRQTGSSSPTRAVVILALAAALPAAPWLAKNTITAGNPVAPFYNRLFPNPYATVSWEREYREFLRDYRHEGDPLAGSDFWNVPYEVTVDGQRLGGLLGALFLVAPAAALFAWRFPAARPLFFAAFITSLPWLDNRGTRFLIPAAAFLGLLAAWPIESLSRRTAIVAGSAVALFHAVSCWPAVILYGRQQIPWVIEGFPWRSALRLEQEYFYLRQRLVGYPTVQALSKLAPVGSRVFSLGPLPECYFPGEILVGFSSAMNTEIMREFYAVTEGNFQPTRLLRLDWPSRPITGFRIRQTGQSDGSFWEISELSFFVDGQPILPRRVSTSLSPWSVKRLTDGDDLTTWRTWRTLEGDEQIEVIFADEAPVDSAEILQPWGQYFSQFAFEVRTSEGLWETIEPLTELSRTTIAPERLTEFARRTLRERKVGFVVTEIGAGGHNVLAAPIDADPDRWGLEEIWREGPRRVYRVR